MKSLFLFRKSSIIFLATIALSYALAAPFSYSNDAVEFNLPRDNCITNFFKTIFARFDPSWKTNPLSERIPNFLIDTDVIEEAKHIQNYGVVASEYDAKLETRVYYSSMGKAKPHGVLPRVDAESPALVVYFHGTGTSKANGSTFNYKANKLSKDGFATLSFDFPFHKDGPRNTKLLKADPFYKWVNQVIEEHRVPGQKIVIAGHSGGATVIAEYLSRYPKSVNGAVMASPVGFNKVLAKWFQTKAKSILMKHKGVKPNMNGAKWSYFIEKQAKWNKGGKYDATVLNPELKLRAVTGELEEFAPGPLDIEGVPMGKRTYDICLELKKLMKNIICTTEPNVGHKLTADVDINGEDIITREIRAAFGQETVEKAAQYAKTRKFSKYDELVQTYRSQPFFDYFIKKYVDPEVWSKMTETGDLALSTQILKEYEVFNSTRAEMILEKIKLTEKTHPQFYETIKDSLKGGSQQRLFALYYDFLMTLKEEERLALTHHTSEAFLLRYRENVAKIVKKIEVVVSDEDKVMLADIFKLRAELKKIDQNISSKYNLQNDHLIKLTKKMSSYSSENGLVTLNKELEVMIRANDKNMFIYREAKDNLEKRWLSSKLTAPNEKIGTETLKMISESQKLLSNLEKQQLRLDFLKNGVDYIRINFRTKPVLEITNELFKRESLMQVPVDQEIKTLNQLLIDLEASVTP